MKIVILILFVVLGGLNGLAQGVLDTTFNGTGINSHSLPLEAKAGMDFQDSPFQDRIVVAFHEINSNGVYLNKIKVRRFLANNGALDASFSGGLATFVPPPPITRTAVNGIAVRDGSNRIFIAAQTNDGCIIVRFNANGSSPVMTKLPNPPGTDPYKDRCVITAIKIKSNRLYAVGNTYIGGSSVATTWRLVTGSIGTSAAIDTAWNGVGWVRTQIKEGTANVFNSFGHSIAFSGSGSSTKIWVLTSASGTTQPKLIESYNLNGTLNTSWGNTSTDFTSITPGGIHRLNLPALPHWASPTRGFFAFDVISNANFIWVGGGVSGSTVSEGIDYRLVRIPISMGNTNYVYPDTSLCRGEAIHKMEFSQVANQLVVAGRGLGSPTDVTVAKYQINGSTPTLQNTWTAPSGSVLGISSSPNPCPGTGDRRRISLGTGSGFGFVGIGLQRGSPNTNKIIVAGFDATDNLRLYRMLP